MAVNLVPTPPLTEITAKWGTTQSEVFKFSYKWTIDNFSYRGEELGEFLQSPEFSAGANDEYKWCLRAYPKGVNDESKEYLSIYLRLLGLPLNKTKIMGKFKISILNVKREQASIRNPMDAHTFKKNEEWGFKSFIQRDFLLGQANNLLPDDKITFFCEVSIVTDSANVSGQSSSVEFKLPESKMTEDLGHLLENSKFSDVTLTVGEEHEFQAHKAILAARSDVFAAMFEHNMSEQTSNRVVITDVDHEVFKEMLNFIYTEKVSNLDKIAVDLLAAADKYALDKLKVMCEEALFLNLSAETAAETLIIAHLHSSTQLKELTMGYIKIHITDVISTNGWQNLMANSTYSSLLTEIIHALASKPQGNSKKRISFFDPV